MPKSSVLVICDRAAEIRPILSERFPDTEIEYAARAEEVGPALEKLNPDVVFSLKSPEFPGSEHVTALHYPSVRWFQVGGSGYEHIVPWDRERMTVTNGAGVLAPFLSETVIGAILTLNGNLHIYRDQQNKSQWRQISFEGLAGKSLLIVGVGAIGGLVAQKATAMGMSVTGLRRNSTPHPAIDRMKSMDALHECLREADYVSLHVRLVNETRHMIGRDELDLMKPGACLLNTARGGVVDEAALVDALRSGSIKAAYLDVFETEPLPEDSPLWSMENAVLTPHAADSVSDWPARFAQFFADNLERWNTGQPLEKIVDF